MGSSVAAVMAVNAVLWPSGVALLLGLGLSLRSDRHAQSDLPISYALRAAACGSSCTQPKCLMVVSHAAGHWEPRSNERQDSALEALSWLSNIIINFSERQTAPPPEPDSMASDVASQGGGAVQGRDQ
jgi:hypothetical protein